MQLQKDVQEFLIFLNTEKGYSKHAIAAYGRDIQQFIEFWHDQHARELNRSSEIEKEHVRSYLVHLVQYGLNKQNFLVRTPVLYIIVLASQYRSGMIMQLSDLHVIKQMMYPQEQPIFSNEKGIIGREFLN